MPQPASCVPCSQYRYLDYLYRLRDFVQEEFGYKILASLEDYPIRQSLQAPYRNAIAHAIDAAALSEPTKLDVDRYYVWRSTPFFVAGNVYYGVTLQHPYYHYPRLERIYPSM